MTRFIALLALVPGLLAPSLISPAWAQYPARGAGPVEAAAHIRAEMARWDRVLKAAGVQPN